MDSTIPERPDPSDLVDLREPDLPAMVRPHLFRPFGLNNIVLLVLLVCGVLDKASGASFCTERSIYYRKSVLHLPKRT